MDQASIHAHSLLSALRAGDSVILVGAQQMGTPENPATVDPYGVGMSRSDGAHGSFESSGISIGWRGGCTRKITVNTLAGYGRIKADGTREVPPATTLYVTELGPASVERHNEITRLDAWMRDEA